MSSTTMVIADTYIPVPGTLETGAGHVTRARWALAALTAVLSLVALAAFAVSVESWTPAVLIALPLVLASAAWVAGGAATSLLGLVHVPAAAPAPPRAAGPVGRTALLFLLCNEDAGPLAAHLDGLLPAIDRAGLGGTTRVFVLSDSFRPEAVAAEERALAPLCAAGRIAYRRRARNEGRKPGNIAEWLAGHGPEFDHMLILDADSRMTAARIARMIRRMEAEPRLGLLQAGIAHVPGRSRFGRHQRLSARMLSPNFVRGFAAWTGTSGNYWGHNALMRVAAFRAAACLPVLPGRAPLGGPILSHDFVEAAWMRRAGWDVVLDPDLGGSAEDGPQTLEEFHRRDRRWCQGNLQHLRLLAEPGLDPVSRLHFISGAFSYIAAPVWLVLVVLIASGAIPVQGGLPLIVTALLLLVSKVFALPRLLSRARTLRRRVVVLRAAVSELVVSTMIAPLVMLRQSASVAAVLLGRDCGWKADRPALRLPRGAAEATAGAGFLLFGAAGGGAATPWLLPLVLPLLGAPVLLRWLEAEA